MGNSWSLPRWDIVLGFFVLVDIPLSDRPSRRGDVDQRPPNGVREAPSAAVPCFVDYALKKHILRFALIR